MRFNTRGLATEVAPTKSPKRHTNYEPCRGEFIRLGITLKNNVCVLILGVWRLKSPLQSPCTPYELCALSGRIYSPEHKRNKEGILISAIWRLKSPLQNALHALQQPYTPKKNALHMTKSQIIKTKKPNGCSVFILSLLMRLNYLLTDEINHQLN